MARYTGPVCKLCRREGMKLFLKGDRCEGEKCSFTRRAYPPGPHGPTARIKLSEYAVRLREKQKVRRIYGVLEKQFRKYYAEATRRRGRTGEELLNLVESRFDNAVFRMGFAATRAEARQLVKHNHFTLNGKKANIPSILLRAGDKVVVREASRVLGSITTAMAQVDKRTALSWIELDKSNFTGTFKGQFSREELNEPAIREQLIIEYYSR